MNSVDIANAILDEIDLEALYKRLTAYGRRLTREMADVFDGISAEDLVGETVVAYLSAESGMKWESTKGSLEGFLCGVLKNKFLMHVRRTCHTALLDNDQSMPQLSAPAVGDGSPSGTVVDLMRGVASGDKELVKLLEAAQGLENGYNVNQQLSERLNIPVAGVVNLKKRFARRWIRYTRRTQGCVHPWS